MFRQNERRIFYGFRRFAFQFFEKYHIEEWNHDPIVTAVRARDRRVESLRETKEFDSIRKILENINELDPSVLRQIIKHSHELKFVWEKSREECRNKQFASLAKPFTRSLKSGKAGKLLGIGNLRINEILERSGGSSFYNNLAYTDDSETTLNPGITPSPSHSRIPGKSDSPSEQKLDKSSMETPKSLQPVSFLLSGQTFIFKLQ